MLINFTLGLTFLPVEMIKSKLITLPDNSAKSHNIKSLPNVSKEFLQWLAGFVDAEGCFSIRPNKSWTSVNFLFSINLHVDDVEVLHKIAKILGVGVVKIDKNRNSAVFYVNKFNDIVRVILPIFQEFPLQTTKHLDFISFSEAVRIKLSVKGTKKIISKPYLIKIQNLKANMNSGRLTIDKEQLEFLTKRVSINVWWLLGFIEGEGTFGYKHLVPYFQIGQHKKNLFVLEAIESFLLNLSKKLCNIIGNQEFNVHYALNQKTNVYSMSVVSIDTLYSYIVPCFQSMSFLTRKALDFHYWVISVKIHKFGYYYLPEGKKIALQISSATNKYRYTTSIAQKIELPSADTISKLLARPAPFDVASGLSHFELARKFTISKAGRNGFTVHIYDRESERGKELTGSPFSTYGAGHVALGLRAGSRVIGRYIDTGKAYKGRYIFSSIPISVSET
jgi:hypothetical protein